MAQVLAETAYFATPNCQYHQFLNLLGPDSWSDVMADPCRGRTGKQHDALYEKLVNDAVTGKASHTVPRPYCWAVFFAKEKPEGDQRRLVRQFAGAIETTTVALLTLVLACICCPNCIAAAQREIDDVVGTDRLLTFDDRPTVEAIVHETPMAPSRFGAPYTEDDVIEH
ncbi:hypothetical protein C0995_006453 [Termitomyces sp. Mi166|nr:hypothetical protein C0995_006453 [Termitomyces sp. Mi166\